MMQSNMDINNKIPTNKVKIPPSKDEKNLLNQQNRKKRYEKHCNARTEEQKQNAEHENLIREEKNLLKIERSYFLFYEDSEYIKNLLSLNLRQEIEFLLFKTSQAQIYDEKMRIVNEEVNNEAERELFIETIRKDYCYNCNSFKKVHKDEKNLFIQTHKQERVILNALNGYGMSYAYLFKLHKKKQLLIPTDIILEQICESRLNGKRGLDLFKLFSNNLFCYKWTIIFFQKYGETIIVENLFLKVLRILGQFIMEF